MMSRKQEIRNIIQYEVEECEYKTPTGLVFPDVMNYYNGVRKTYKSLEKYDAIRIRKYIDILMS